MFLVSINFESLGSDTIRCRSREDAERVARKFRRALASAIAQWPIISTANAPFGEREIWRRAAEIAGPDAKVYGPAAGEFVAGVAVVVERD